MLGEICLRRPTNITTIDYLTRLRRLPIGVDDTMPAARQAQVMALAREYGLTSYDATYLDLALQRRKNLNVQFSYFLNLFQNLPQIEGVILHMSPLIFCNTNIT